MLRAELWQGSLPLLHTLRLVVMSFFTHMKLIHKGKHTGILLQLLTANELTPGITHAEYSQRRATLASLMPANSFAVLPGAAAQYMVGMIPYPFRQDADFRYLTGLLQKNLVAVVESACRGTSCDTTRPLTCVVCKLLSVHNAWCCVTRSLCDHVVQNHVWTHVY